MLSLDFFFHCYVESYYDMVILPCVPTWTFHNVCIVFHRVRLFSFPGSTLVCGVIFFPGRTWVIICTCSFSKKKTPHTGVDPGKLNERTHSVVAFCLQCRAVPIGLFSGPVKLPWRTNTPQKEIFTWCYRKSLILPPCKVSNPFPLLFCMSAAT